MEYNSNVLNNVTFTINPGEMVGIMGGTGCGKTTIVELLLRLYNIEENKIFVDGYDIMKLPLKLVRDVIAYVPQETFLFKQTINENTNANNISNHFKYSVFIFCIVDAVLGFYVLSKLLCIRRMDSINNAESVSEK